MALQWDILEAMASGHESGRSRGRPRWGPLDQPLATADGHLALSAGDAALPRLLDTLGSRGAPPDSASRQAFVAARFLGEPSLHWEEALGSADVPCAAGRDRLGTRESMDLSAGVAAERGRRRC